ncbi:MAG: CDP-diacylglycerol--glycerol-3-phosphate 3-phosphatidyltransferase [Thermoanaerobacteraceae bacterium]|nr:CDP-diacylglycerol--glycerol-3-phosphate 3-phosphatidyltransferase [Thermoanaerobacteraceae bacterium]
MGLANKLTLLRIFLIPVIIIVMLSNLENSYIVAAVLFITAALTDKLDGYIARSRNEITKFGKLIDPIADKLLVTATLIILVELGKLPAWIAIIIIGREFVVTGIRMLALTEGVIISASNLGKLKTFTQIIAICSLILNNYPFNLINIPFSSISMFVALVITIISGLDYIYKSRQLIYNI